jgi:hypothetical protein
MRQTEVNRTHTENGALLALTLACYVVAVACVLVVSHTFVTLAASDIGRHAAVAVTPDGL